MMKNFFYLEGAYLILGFIILLITLFVTTRPFMSQGAVKKGLVWVSLVIAVAIAGHYSVTTSRMAEVKEAFESNQVIICERRVRSMGLKCSLLL